VCPYLLYSPTCCKHGKNLTHQMIQVPSIRLPFSLHRYRTLYIRGQTRGRAVSAASRCPTWPASIFVYIAFFALRFIPPHTPQVEQTDHMSVKASALAAYTSPWVTTCRYGLCRGLPTRSPDSCGHFLSSQVTVSARRPYKALLQYTHEFHADRNDAMCNLQNRTIPVVQLTQLQKLSTKNF
jgi:hypothetical protein